MQHLPLDTVVVPNALDGRVKWLAGLEVQADDVTLRCLLLQGITSQSWTSTYARPPVTHLQRHNRILHVEAAVCS